MDKFASALDFIIIGAQKSATTSLYHYLQGHPQIVMPAAKEAPFFVGDNYQPHLWPEFCEQHFSGAPDDALLGKATPQYMADVAAAERIHSLFPNTKLIAVLRDPIDRAWSHYKMDLRRETESRTFNEAVEQLLDTAALQNARTRTVPLHQHGLESESDFYLVWSEYGRILENYLHFFDRSQLLVLSMDDIRTEPQCIMDRILQFLDLPSGYSPANLGSVSHQGGGKPIVSRKARDAARNNPLLSVLWNTVPEHRKQTIRYWFEQINVRKSNDEKTLSPTNEAALRAHFATDLSRLTQHTEFDADWLTHY